MSKITFETVVDALAQDTALSSELTASISATELPARSPAALYLAARRDLTAIGIDPDAALDVLPEPWSNQDRKIDGLNRTLGDNERKHRDADPKRYWDKYKYKVQTGEEVSGSVYSDMAARHPIGSTIKDNIKLIDAWLSTESEKSTLVKDLVHNGVTMDLGDPAIPNSRWETIRSTLTARFNKLAENFRIMSAIHKNIREINEKMSDKVRIDFVYNEEGVPESGLAELKQPIRIKWLSPSGEASGSQRAFTAKAFANLSVEMAIEKGGEKGPTYATLIDSKKVKLKLPGKGESTQEKGKAAIEGRVNVGNLLTNIGDNIGTWVDSFDSLDAAVTLATKRLFEMPSDTRLISMANAVAIRDFYNAFVTKDMESVAFAQTKINREKAQRELAERMKREAATKEAESQPTQNERNQAARDEMRTQSGEDVEAARQRATEANKPTAKPAAPTSRKPAAPVGRQAAK